MVSTSWLFLALAGIFEVCWAIGLKYSQGFSRLWPSLFTIGSMGISMYFLAKAALHLPIGLAYAVWVGIGAFGATIFGIFLFNESTSPLKLAFLALLLISVIGLKMTS